MVDISTEKRCKLFPHIIREGGGWASKRKRDVDAILNKCDNTIHNIYCIRICLSAIAENHEVEPFDPISTRLNIQLLTHFTCTNNAYHTPRLYTCCSNTIASVLITKVCMQNKFNHNFIMHAYAFNSVDTL